MDFKDVFRDVRLTEPFSIKYLLTNFWHDVGDHRVDDYFIFKFGPLPMLITMGSYLVFSTILGPRLMKNREPFNGLPIKILIITYNLTMVLVNAFFLCTSIYYLRCGLELFTMKTLFYDRYDYTNHTMEQIVLVHLYYLSKFADLLDTIFFVVRKKQSHITMLHLYHHTVVPFLGWPLVRVSPMLRPFGIFCLCNCFIHTVMYFYYALSAMGPSMRRFLWWKKILTQMQIGQFMIYGAYAAYLIIRFRPDYPLWMYFLTVSQPLIFFTLFTQFYFKAYGRSSVKKDDNENEITTNNKQKVENNRHFMFFDYMNLKNRMTEKLANGAKRYIDEFRNDNFGKTE